MAPRTRVSGTNRENSVIYNSRGLPAFPLELLHHIVSYTREPEIPWFFQCPVNYNHWRERRVLIRALCRVCRSLRAALLPLYWETVGACSPAAKQIDKSRAMSYGKKRVKALAKQLLGQLDLITNNATPYASYVRSVNVVMEPAFANDALPKLAHAMTLMRTLHTVQIITPGYTMVPGPPMIQPSQFEKAFGVHVYPSVRRVILPFQARDIFHCFPQVRDVRMNQIGVTNTSDFEQFARESAHNCPLIESFGWPEHPHHWDSIESRASAVVTNLPHLRRVEYYVTEYFLPRQGEFLQLSKLRNLEKVTLVFGRLVAKNVHGVEQVTEMAKKVLALSPHPNKCLDVVLAEDMLTISHRI